MAFIDAPRRDVHRASMVGGWSLIPPTPTIGPWSKRPQLDGLAISLWSTHSNEEPLWGTDGEAHRVEQRPFVQRLAQVGDSALSHALLAYGRGVMRGHNNDGNMGSRAVER